MEKRFLKESIQRLKDLIFPIEDDIKSKILKNIDILDCIIYLWSNLSKGQFEGLFNSQINATQVNEIIKLLNEIYDWKIIDNQYDPKKDILQKNTMDYALKNLIQFVEKDEILDICSGFFRPKV